jgi:hypothetical protein
MATGPNRHWRLLNEGKGAMAKQKFKPKENGKVGDEDKESLVLRMLFDMRELLQEVHGKCLEHDQRFTEARKSIEDWKETTASGVGFAAHANIRSRTLEKEIADLKDRIDRIERAH